jgi:Skp family chaperone for outer membrane proteins
MKSLKILTSIAVALSFAAPLVAQDAAEEIDKIGTVDMQKLVSEYYKTDLTREAFKEYEVGIKKENEERVEKIKVLVEEARGLQKQGDDKSLTPQKKDEFFRKASEKNQRATALANERVAWVGRKQAALSEKANVEFAELRAEIVVVVKRVGVERDYDFILDRSGSSGAQVPILSYAKDATDLTAIVIVELNKDAPKESDEEKDGGSKPE